MGKLPSNLAKWIAIHKKATSTSKTKKTTKATFKMTPVSKGHKPKGKRGMATVKAIGRTKTTGNFKKIQRKSGKGAAINAYQNKLKAFKKGKK